MRVIWPALLGFGCQLRPTANEAERLARASFLENETSLVLNVVDGQMQRILFRPASRMDDDDR